MGVAELQLPVEKKEVNIEGTRQREGRKEDVEKQRQEHAADFEQRTGMTKERCYRLFLTSLSLRTIGTSWFFMVFLEYTRYYVINDLSKMAFLEVATGSPSYLVQAFIFPVWGVVADRVSRKRVLVLSSLAMCGTCCLLTAVPCIPTYILTRLLALVADVGEPVRQAILRDLYCDADWESENGGATGIQSRIVLVTTVAFGVGGVLGMLILEAGNLGIGLPNEYTLAKADCEGRDRCVPEGQFSLNGYWQVDGCLRLMMILSTVAMIADFCLVALFFPETVRLEHRSEVSILRFLRQNWRDLKPWSNLRVLATRQLRLLMIILMISASVSAGSSTIFLSFYSRFEFDTLTMFLHNFLAGLTGWIVTFFVPKLVERFGDLLGVWVPAGATMLAFMVCAAALPYGYGSMAYVIWPLLVGPSYMLGVLAPNLLSKLIPSDVQGTFQTALLFMTLLLRGVCPWFWQAIFVESEGLPYPWDAMPFWVAIAIGSLSMGITIKATLRDNPKADIDAGRALQAFWDSDYVQSGAYELHGGCPPEGKKVDLSTRRKSSPTSTIRRIRQLVVGLRAPVSGGWARPGSAIGIFASLQHQIRSGSWRQGLRKSKSWNRSSSSSSTQAPEPQEEALEEMEVHRGIHAQALWEESDSCRAASRCATAGPSREVELQKETQVSL